MAAARTPEEIRRSIEANRAELGLAVDRLRGEVAEITDWRKQLNKHRKEILIGAAVAGFVLGGGIAAPDRAGERRGRRRLRLAVGLYTLRAGMEADLHAALAGLAGVGAHEVELAGLHGRSAAAMRSALDAAGLAAVSGHWPLERFEREPEALLEDATHARDDARSSCRPSRGPRTTAEADALVGAGSWPRRSPCARPGWASPTTTTRSSSSRSTTARTSGAASPSPGSRMSPTPAGSSVAGRDPVAVLGRAERALSARARQGRRAAPRAADGRTSRPGTACRTGRGSPRLAARARRRPARGRARPSLGRPARRRRALAGDAPRGARAVGRLTVFVPAPNRAGRAGALTASERGPRLQRPTSAGHSLTYHAGLGGRRIALKEGHEGPRQGVSVTAGLRRGGCRRGRRRALGIRRRRLHRGDVSAAGGSCCTR